MDAKHPAQNAHWSKACFVENVKKCLLALRPQKWKCKATKNVKNNPGNMYTMPDCKESWGRMTGDGGHHVTSGVQTPTIDRNYPLYGHLWTCHARVSLANRRLVFLRTAIKPGLFQLGVWNTASAEPIKAFYKFATWKSREMGQNRAEKGDRGIWGPFRTDFILENPQLASLTPP